MSDKIKELKKLNAAYIAALEWDYCPEPTEAKKVKKLFKTGLSDEDLQEGLDENQGRRSDEIVLSMSELIKTL